MKRVVVRLFVGALMLTGAVARAGLELEPVASGFSQPTVLAAAGDGSDRLFLAEKAGRIWVIVEGKVGEEPFLDISDRVFSTGGNGLLGLAFDPRYGENGFFYLYYTGRDQLLRVSRFRVANRDPERGRPSSETILFLFDRPAGGHKGGDLAFGPDGRLYLATGDGSDGADPDDNAQSLESLYGKILRFHVEGGGDIVPSDNPFVDDPGARPEIWAYGLRNPWRMSFDRETGELFIADVGERQLEEVNLQPADSSGGENYGWRRMEGSACFEPAENCEDGSLTAPILEYGHDLGCSITGGYRYRGRRSPTLFGHYLFSDFCSGRIWGAEPNRNGVWIPRLLAKSGRSIVTFGQADDGELYVVDFGAGEVLRLVSPELFASGFESGALAGWKRRGPVTVVEPGLFGSGFALAAEAVPGREAAVRRRIERGVESLKMVVELDLSALELAAGATEILAWRRGSRTPVRVLVRQVSERRYRFELRVADGEGEERRIGGFRAASARPLRLEIAWTAPSSEGADDGMILLSKNGRRRARARNLGSESEPPRRVELGLLEGGPPGSGGRLLLDGVVLSR